MLFFKQKKTGLRYFVEHFLAVVGIVLVWRGIWYMLDKFDVLLFGGNHLWTALGGIALGLALLYLPDNDLRELKQH